LHLLVLSSQSNLLRQYLLPFQEFLDLLLGLLHPSNLLHQYYPYLPSSQWDQQYQMAPLSLLIQ
jgi:hypothetical protein